MVILSIVVDHKSCKYNIIKDFQLVNSSKLKKLYLMQHLDTRFSDKTKNLINIIIMILKDHKYFLLHIKNEKLIIFH